MAEPLDVEGSILRLGNPPPALKRANQLGWAYYFVLANFEGNPFRGSGWPKDVTCYEGPHLPTAINSYDWLWSGWLDYWKWRLSRTGNNYPMLDSLTADIAKAIGYVESRMGTDPNMNVENNAKAMGPMQLTPQALQDLMTVGTRGDVGGMSCCGVNVMDRNDIIQSIAGGIRYFIKLGFWADDWSDAYKAYSNADLSEGENPVARFEEVLCQGTDPYYHSARLFTPSGGLDFCPED
jgi:hypothetical protein